MLFKTAAIFSGESSKRFHAIRAVLEHQLQMLDAAVVSLTIDRLRGIGLSVSTVI